MAEAPPPDPNEGRTFTGTVTSTGGGRVMTEGDTFRVEVPAGAIDDGTSVTVRVSPAAGGSATSVYELGPDGATFRHPVLLSLRFDEPTLEGSRVVLAFRDGNEWRAIPGSREIDNRIVAATRHFSAFAAVRVDDSTPVYPWPEGQGDEAAMTYWTWTDPTTSMDWQVPSAVRVMNWHEALDYCASLDLDGGGWRLPSIDELRTLVRGCPATAPGGSCAVTNECTDMWACFAAPCGGCMDGGCNWDPALFYEGESNCVPGYWSSTVFHAVVPGTGEPTPEDGLWAWYLSFGGAHIGWNEMTGMMGGGDIRVRCVR